MTVGANHIAQKIIENSSYWGVSQIFLETTNNE